MFLFMVQVRVKTKAMISNLMNFVGGSLSFVLPPLFVDDNPTDFVASCFSFAAISSKFPGHSIWPNQGRISFPNGRMGFVREVMNRQISSLLSFQFHSAILGERPFGTMVETWDGIYLLEKQHHRYPFNWWTISHSTYLPNWIEFIEIQWMIFHSTWQHPFAWVSEDGRLYANVSPVSVTASFCKGRGGRCGAQFGSTNRKWFVKPQLSDVVSDA